MIHPGVRRLGLGLLVWAFASIGFLEAIDQLTYNRVFVAWLIGFLALRELVPVQRVPPRWRARLNWILGAGLVAFAILTGRQILMLV